MTGRVKKSKGQGDIDGMAIENVLMQSGRSAGAEDARARVCMLACGSESVGPTSRLPTVYVGKALSPLSASSHLLPLAHAEPIPQPCFE